MTQHSRPNGRRTAAPLLTGLVLLATTATAAAKGEPSIKIGLDRLAVSGAKYTHEDLLTTVEKSNQDDMAGAQLFGSLAEVHRTRAL